MEQKLIAQLINSAIYQNLLGKEVAEQRYLDLVGVGPYAPEITETAKDKGLQVQYLDDVTTAEGRAKVKAALRKVRPGGVIWLSQRSSGWIWLTRNSTGRSRSTPEGDLKKESVRLDNQIAGFYAGLSRFAHQRDVRVVWETTGSSLLPTFPPVRRTMAEM